MQVGASIQNVARVAAQIGFVLASFAALALAPPRRGAVMLVPLDGASRAALAPAAVAGGALLLARGPLPASLVVNGSRDRLRDAFRNMHVLIVAAPPRWCGRTVA
jgi:hypothetical protein